MILSAPAGADASGLAKGTTMSLDIVKDSLLGSVGTMLRILGPYVAGALLLVVLVVVAIAARRVRREVRQANASIDPRDLVDPGFSDVLGEW